MRRRKEVVKEVETRETEKKEKEGVSKRETGRSWRKRRRGGG